MDLGDGEVMQILEVREKEEGRKGGSWVGRHGTEEIDGRVKEGTS